ncbi:MAG: hypothetical protein J0L63_17850 [Anaerolineae bacterium]|nr:hypothetical protein [Anaerolineae bacterium]
MLLSEYQWSLNPRGMHNSFVYRGPSLERCQRLQLGWYKMVAAGGEFLGDCQTLLANNITPVIRIYRDSPGVMQVDSTFVNLWRQYAGAGVKWFEFYNEPNLINEWPSGNLVFNPGNVAQIIGPVMETWLTFAETIIGLGAYPAFPALAEAGGYDQGTIPWLDAMLIYLRDRHRDRFINIINNGLWLATHPYTLNHFYQEVSGQPYLPRDMRQQNGTEGGWHFEYPYDPICQATDPGRTVFGGTALTPYGDPNGITAVGIAFHYRLSQWFDSGVVPVMGTEGGVFPYPFEAPQQPDKRYPPYDKDSMGEATVAMFNWIADESPPWFFGIALWKENDYYDNNATALVRMEQVPQRRRVVPPLSSLEPGAYNGYIGRGPGPIRGEPSFHVVILAPGLEPEWFFESGRAYWNTFRPIVTSVWDYIKYIPYDRSLAATVIAPPDMAESLREVIQKQYPNVLFDLILTDGDPTSIADILNARVWANRRFG